MKITSVEAFPVRVPLVKPIVMLPYHGASVRDALSTTMMSADETAAGAIDIARRDIAA